MMKLLLLGVFVCHVSSMGIPPSATSRVPSFLRQYLMAQNGQAPDVNGQTPSANPNGNGVQPGIQPMGAMGNYISRQGLTPNAGQMGNNGMQVDQYGRPSHMATGQFSSSNGGPMNFPSANGETMGYPSGGRQMPGPQPGPRHQSFSQQSAGQFPPSFSATNFPPNQQFKRPISQQQAFPKPMARQLPFHQLMPGQSPFPQSMPWKPQFPQPMPGYSQFPQPMPQHPQFSQRGSLQTAMPHLMTNHPEYPQPMPIHPQFSPQTPVPLPIPGHPNFQSQGQSQFSNGRGQFPNNRFSQQMHPSHTSGMGQFSGQPQQEQLTPTNPSQEYPPSPQTQPALSQSQIIIDLDPQLVPKFTSMTPTEINTLLNKVLVNYFENGLGEAAQAEPTTPAP